MYKQMLDGYDQTRKEAKEATQIQDPALAYNRELLKKYDNELAYFTSGNAKTGLEQWKKDMDKAVQDAKAKQ